MLVAAAGVAPPVAGQVQTRSEVEGYGYVFRWSSDTPRGGRFELNGTEVPADTCYAQRDRCRVVFSIEWTVSKGEPDSQHDLLPVVCSVVRAGMEGELRSSGRQCEELGVGERVTQGALVSVPAREDETTVAVTVDFARRSSTFSTLQTLAALRGSWPVSTAPPRKVGLLTIVLVAVAAGALLVAAGALLRRARRQRTDRGPLMSEAPVVADSAEGDGLTSTASGHRGVPTMQPAALPAAIRLEIEPADLPADGRSPASVVARVVGAGDEALRGVRVDFSTDESGVGGVFASSSAVTDGDGCARTTFTMPARASGGRIYITAVTGTAQPERAVIAQREWLRVRQLLLHVTPERALLRLGSDSVVELHAVLRDDAGEPVTRTEVRADVVDAAGGSVAPETAMSDADGRAVFLYTAGDRPADVRVRLWPEGRPRLAREVVIEQV